MTNAMVPPQPGKINFAGMVGAKRRRMRSGGNVSTLNHSSPKAPDPAMELNMDDDEEEKTAQTSKCKGTTTIPIFLKKTYKMIDTCDQTISSWTTDGEMFVVKDPDLFASKVIPQYFDHNKFSSFARQLNFYGFRKMQSKPIRNSDFDANTAKHVTFYNENFKRGRCDLLKKIQRSTRGGGTNTGQDQQREVQSLKEKVFSLEKTIGDMNSQVEERMRRLELDMLGRMEQMMLAMQQQQQAQLQIQSGGSAKSTENAPKPPSSNPSVNQHGSSNSGQTLASMGIEGWDPLPYGARGTSIGSISALGTFGAPALGMTKNGTFAAPVSLDMTKNISTGSGPTLPPHPKQKQLPTRSLPGALSLPPGRLNSLRGISNLSRGISGLSRGLSSESQSSALLSNPWEDKFFSMLMSGERVAAAQAGVDSMNPTPMADGALPVGLLSRDGSLNPAILSHVSSIGQAGLGV